jgi:hypothetical protein
MRYKAMRRRVALTSHSFARPAGRINGPSLLNSQLSPKVAPQTFLMSKYNPLTFQLEGWFDKPLCDLPDAIRQRIAEEFLLTPWDSYSAEERRSVTIQLDYQNDPASKKERQDSWDNAKRALDINAEIAIWEAIYTPTALDLAKKETKLEALHQKLDRIKGKDFVEVGSIDTSPNPAQLKKEYLGDDDLQATGATNELLKRQGSTVRRNARKFATQAKYEKVQKEYRTLRKNNPDKSGVWCSLQIAKMKIGQGLKAETIRRRMKK